MKTFVRLMLVAAILLAGAAASPAVLAQGEGGVPDDIGEPGQYCRQVEERLQSVLNQIRKQTQKFEHAWRRALHAAGHRGEVTMRAMRQVFGRLFDWLRSGGVRLSHIEALAWAEFTFAMFERMDRRVENLIAEILMSHGVPEDQARAGAEEISDNIAHDNIQGGGPQLWWLHLELHMNELEEEQRKCKNRETFRNRGINLWPQLHPDVKPQGRYYPPVGDGRGGYFVGGNPFLSNQPCSPSSPPPVPVDTPTLPQSPPGSNGTSGTVDGGTITVSASPC